MMVHTLFLPIFTAAKDEKYFSVSIFSPFILTLNSNLIVEYMKNFLKRTFYDCWINKVCSTMWKLKIQPYQVFNNYVRRYIRWSSALLCFWTRVMHPQLNRNTYYVGPSVVKIRFRMYEQDKKGFLSHRLRN